MLAGIAGRTIEEARERMPVDEIPIWQAYIKERGPLSAQRRIEFASAQIASIVANQNRDSKKPPLSIKDFLLWSQEQILADEPEDLQKAFGEIMKVSGTRKEGTKKLWRRRKS